MSSSWFSVDFPLAATSARNQANTTPRKMSSNDSQDRQNSDSSEVTDATSPSSPVQAAWRTVKTSFKGKSSMPEMRRWFSSSRASESNEPIQREATRSGDEEDGLFCESLLGLMQRNERFDYLGLLKDEKKKESENTGGKDRSKRFSWTR